MRIRYSSLFRCSRVSKKAKFALKIVVPLLCLSVAIQASAVLLFHDDFEKDSIGDEPSKWEGRTRRKHNRRSRRRSEKGEQ